jgi:hypothetical protein
MPKSVAVTSLAIDCKMETDFWKKAIEKEMKNAMPAFEIRDNNMAPIGTAQENRLSCHL